MNSFQKSLDRYLTAAPCDDFTDWCEEVINHFSDSFYEVNEGWISEDSGVCNTWLNKLFAEKPSHAANVIERTFKLYKL